MANGEMMAWKVLKKSFWPFLYCLLGHYLTWNLWKALILINYNKWNMSNIRSSYCNITSYGRGKSDGVSIHNPSASSLTARINNLSSLSVSSLFRFKLLSLSDTSSLISLSSWFTYPAGLILPTLPCIISLTSSTSA